MNIDFSQKILDWKGEPASEPLFKIVDGLGNLVDPKYQHLTQNDAQDRMQRLGLGHSLVKSDERPYRLGPFLAPLIAVGKVPPEKAPRTFAISYRIREGDKDVELAAEDVTLMMELVDANEQVFPWVKASVRYLIDPGSIAEEERKVFDLLYRRNSKKPAADKRR